MKITSIALITTTAFLLTACENPFVEASLYSDIPFGIDFTPDEKNIWEDLNDEQRKRAISFISHGGTLIASLGDK